MHFKRGLSCLVALSLILSPISTYAAASNSTTAAVATTANSLNGFKQISSKYSTELGTQVFEYEHIKSGGRVIYVAANDDHKVMDIIAKTPAVDNTGANHVLEHALLSGSEKYPTKSPFNSVVETSVNTEANAYTYEDRTVFAFSTKNNKDFDNLKRVYLDAVFAPKLLKEPNILKREGWRYQYKNGSKDLEYAGVVYSEMLGSYSSASTVHQMGISQALFPKTTFANDSGGVPEKIVDLTQDHLKQTYLANYHPSNMLVYYYGKMDILNELKYLDQNYWSKYAKKTIKQNYGAVGSLEPTTKLINKFHVDRSQDTVDNTTISVSYSLPTNMPKKDRIGMGILVDLLSNVDGAPMRMDFNDTGLGSSFGGYSNAISLMPYVSFAMGSSNLSQADKFGDFVDSTLNYYANGGVPADVIKNSIKYTTLQNRLKNISVDRGKSIRELVEKGFVSFNDPMYAIDTLELEKSIYQEGLTGDYFKNLIDKYLLNSTRKALVVTVPEVGLNDIKDEAIAANLNKRIAKLTSAQKTQLDKEIQAFNAWNNKADASSDLAKIPVLKLSDIQYQVDMLKPDVEQDGSVKYLYYPVKAKGINDLTLYFDISGLSDQERMDLKLLEAYYVNMNTKNKKSTALDNILASDTLGLNFVLAPLTGSDRYHITTERYSLNVTYTTEDGSDVENVLEEILNYQLLDSKAFTKYILEEFANNAIYNISSDYDDVANAEFKKHMTPSASALSGSLSDEKTYRYYKGLLTDIDAQYPALLKRLQAVYEKVFVKQNLVVSLAGDDSTLDASKVVVKKLVNSLDQGSAQSPVEHPVVGMGKSEAIIVPAQVQYIYKGFNLHEIGETFKGSYLVFAQYINNHFAYEQLRVQNGAYGGYFTASPSGNIFFSSYRDPNLGKSIDSMDGILNWIRTQHLTQAELDPIIVSIVGQLDQPKNILKQTDMSAENTIAGYDLKMSDQLMQEVLKTTPEDLAKFISILEKGLPNATTVVAGSEDSIDKDRSRFDEIRKLLE